MTIIHPRLVWIHGLTPPGKMNDMAVIKDRLRQKMKDDLLGRRLIGDSGYSGEPDFISTKTEFEDRTMARHETFNQRLKCFAILKIPF